MIYRCLTCGYAQDFVPTPEENAKHFPWMKGEETSKCPACVQYLKKYGGRKPGKLDMPDIVDAGEIIEETEEVAQMVAEIDADLQKLASGDKSVASKYVGKKLFGFSADDLDELHMKREESKARVDA